MRKEREWYASVLDYDLDKLVVKRVYPVGVYMEDHSPEMWVICNCGGGPDDIQDLLLDDLYTTREAAEAEMEAEEE